MDNNFKLVKKFLTESKISHQLIQVEADSLSVDDHIKALGEDYANGMSTLLFTDESGKVFAVLRRDDRKLDLKTIKSILNVKKFEFCNGEKLKSIGLEEGLVSPFLLVNNSKIEKVLIDRNILDARYVICGSADRNTAIKISPEIFPSILVNSSVENITILNEDRVSGSRKKRILTGDRPTGKLHIGHLFGSLLNRVKLQNEYETFILMANIHAISDNFDNPQKVKDSMGELLCDYYAAGINFDLSTVYIQSEVPEVHEIFMYLANFSTLQQLLHNPTLKTEIKQNQMEKSTPLGFFVYPLHQAADILCVNADLVPVGQDQAPMIEETREVARKFNQTYKKKILSQPQALFGGDRTVPGVDGNAKMGKSLGNGIYLADSKEELRKKVFSVFTDPNRIKATDPGNVEGNVAFTYHDLFNNNLEEVEDLKERYRLGKVGDVEVKEKLFIAMNDFLEPIRERRYEAEKMKGELLSSALEGSKKVQKIARGIADQMKEAMMIKFK